MLTRAQEIETIAMAVHKPGNFNCAHDLLFKLSQRGMKVKHLIKYLDKLKMERVLLMLKEPGKLKYHI